MADDYKEFVKRFHAMVGEREMQYQLGNAVMYSMKKFKPLLKNKIASGMGSTFTEGRNNEYHKTNRKFKKRSMWGFAFKDGKFIKSISGKSFKAFNNLDNLHVGISKSNAKNLKLQKWKPNFGGAYVDRFILKKIGDPIKRQETAFQNNVKQEIIKGIDLTLKKGGF